MLPGGLEVMDAAEAAEKSLGDLLQASDWRLHLPGTPAGALASAAEGLLSAQECSVDRMTKNGVRTFDVRSAVVSLVVLDDETLDLRSLHEAPLVRPDDVLTALRRLDDRLTARPLLTRLRQGPLGGDDIGDPLF